MYISFPDFRELFDVLNKMPMFINCSSLSKVVPIGVDPDGPPEPGEPRDPLLGSSAGNAAGGQGVADVARGAGAHGGWKTGKIFLKIHERMFMQTET